MTTQTNATEETQATTINWDTATTATKAASNYINIGQDGSYSIRILSNPRVLTKFWTDIGGKKRCVNGDAGGRLLAASKVDGSGVQPPQTKYAVLAFDSDKKQLGILEFGVSVFNSIVTIKQNPKMRIKDITAVTFLVDVLASRKVGKYNVQVLERHADAFVMPAETPDLDAYCRMSDDTFLDTMGVPAMDTKVAELFNF
jgi:hypothetical protein